MDGGVRLMRRRGHNQADFLNFFNTTVVAGTVQLLSAKAIFSDQDTD
jgi:hypothetical protein